MVFGIKLKKIRLQFKPHFINNILLMCNVKQITIRSEFVMYRLPCVGIQTDENKANHVTY